ncbi:hypothetical protein A3K86_08305 [Photobacterium jeanii]|uniref:HTH tetR-type domain-containing protein n=1 Tax=Photobacterium jeanii TaxID=858640 RepID=A0A178KIY6_9GAMM|nr:TetR/AcrR family transcriptional regulator [Photobacterium jeanii]OAN17096.1 hypothetical protein A3K86_08305 [Photobacterium jeanii]PST88433.1 TetR/AcrR family transcriptional regulator [Photobacterium jeanii]
MNNKKQRILDTALTLFVDQGIQATATAHIAKQAGVANGTLFHHFATKESLIAALYLQIKTELGDSLPDLPSQPTDSAALTPESFKAAFAHRWQLALQWALNNPNKLHFLRQVAHAPQFSIAQQHEMMTTTMANLVPLLEYGIDQQQLAARPLPLLLNFCHSHYLATAHLFIERPDYCAAPDYQHHAFELFWQALCVMPSSQP